MNIFEVSFSWFQLQSVEPVITSYWIYLRQIRIKNQTPECQIQNRADWSHLFSLSKWHSNHCMKPVQYVSLFARLLMPALLAAWSSQSHQSRSHACFTFFPTGSEERRDCLQSYVNYFYQCILGKKGPWSLLCNLTSIVIKSSYIRCQVFFVPAPGPEHPALKASLLHSL